MTTTVATTTPSTRLVASAVHMTATFLLVVALVSAALGAAAGTAAAEEASTVRLSGPSRFDTAVQISRDLFDDASTDQLVLVSGQGFADALGGTVLAAQLDAPLLLTARTQVPSVTAAEIQRVLRPGGTVTLIGGTAVIDGFIEDRISAAGYQVARIAGAGRFQTARLVAEQQAAPTEIFLADGSGFADGLVAAATAAQRGGVLLLTTGPDLDHGTADYLSAHPELPVTAVGGIAATATMPHRPDAVAIAGFTSAHTSALVAERFHPAPSVVGIASDADYPDGLAGGLHIARTGGPLLLTDPAHLNVTVERYLDVPGLDDTLSTAVLYGGTVALSDDVDAAAAAEVDGLHRSIRTVGPHMCVDQVDRVALDRLADTGCADDHQLEIYAVATHPAVEHPGEDEVEDQAREVCTGTLFSDYVGIDYSESRWFVRAVGPDAGAWADGDRGIVCFIYEIAGPKSRTAYQTGE